MSKMQTSLNNLWEINNNGILKHNTNIPLKSGHNNQSKQTGTGQHVLSSSKIWNPLKWRRKKEEKKQEEANINISVMAGTSWSVVKP